jgi:hypothetical protein
MKERTLLIDGHVHFYPNYNFQKGIANGIAKMAAAVKKINPGGPTTTVWMLTERWDCSFFEKLSANPDAYNFDIFRFENTGEDTAVRVIVDEKQEHYIISGWQIVSSDGLEILGLALEDHIPDRSLSTTDLIEAVNAANGIPVLNWAPGKWFFSRGKIVESILKNQNAGHFVVGDNPLRNICWPKPKLMRYAAEKGFSVIAGSDPLPFDGEEKYIGSYNFTMNGAFDREKPASSIRELLQQPRQKLAITGRRNGVFEFISRETRIMLKK